MTRHDEDAGALWEPVTARLAEHAARTPDAIAVETAAGRITYADLAVRVDRLAARLWARLASAPADGDRLIGIGVPRDLDLIAWLLAIMKVGGAYLPLDPGLPPQRLAQVLEDAAPQLIVAGRDVADAFGANDVPVLIAEDDEADGVLPPAPAIALTPDALAYVIFTSGSTGRPKGVEIAHGSLVALLDTMATMPGFAVGERMLGMTRISFDLSVPDLFLPCHVGGTLVLVSLETAADPDRLIAAFDRFRPDLVQGTPSTWRALIEAGWTGLPDLRILSGGEAMTRALADRLLSCCADLWNIYGPTETTVWATAYRVLPGRGAVPVGRPLAGVEVQVTDDALRPVARGEVGEIVIGGTGVARGYRNRPALTAERFVRVAGGGRAYRTGDLGRLDAEGRLVCLGRADDQVKVRGFRIELGDVEAALAAHPDVAWCAARLWPDSSGSPALIGYVVTRSGRDGDPAGALRTFLADRLPAYMIPDRMVAIPVMPLTPNGKVDRAALPDPFVAPAESAAGDDSVQARLATIWCELLGVARVAAEDDFFALGGYSLMTVRLVRRIEAAFGERLQLVELMRYPTLGAMAGRIARGQGGDDPVMLLAGPDAGGRPPLFWLDAGPLIRGVAQAMPADQPVYALNADSTDEAALAAGTLTIQAVAARLRARLRAFQPQGPYRIAGWCRWGIVAYEVAQQLRADGHAVALLVLLDTAHPRLDRIGLRGRIGRWFHGSQAAVVEPPSLSQRVEVAGRGYRPEAYDGDVVLVLPTTTPGDGGWGAVVRGTLSVRRAAGDHVAMVRAPHAAPLGALIGRALAERQDRPAPRAAMSSRQAASAATG